MTSSFTAETMALQRAFESVRPNRTRLFEDPLARCFLSSKSLRAVASLASIPVAGRLVPALYDLTWPGPRPSAVARTRLIDDTVGEIVSGGVDQVVLLGAGFDSRAWRLESLARATVIEVDRAGTQAAKISALCREDRDLQRVVFVAVDFERDDLEASVSSAGLDTERPALFVWEGVTNYLSAEAVDHTLKVIRSLAGPGSALVFTYVHRGVIDGTSHFPEAARWVKSVGRVGEPWTFGLLPDETSSYLAERGFCLSWDVSTAEAGAKYFGPLLRRDRASRLYRVALAGVECPA